MASTTQALPVALTRPVKSTENTPQSKKQVISPGISLASGTIAGAVEASVTYPFEFAKTRAQLQRSHAHTASRNPFAILTQTARTDGVRAIYTGCSTLILGTAFKAGVRFLSFDSIRNQLASSDGKLSPARGILAGMLAGCFEALIAVTPTERIKTALIDDARSARRYNGGVHALRTIIAEHGLREVYRGLVSTTMKQAATSATRMGSYNILKEAVAARRGKQQWSKTTEQMVTFGTGALAGVITVYVTQPFDTIKTRAQGAKGQGTIEAARSVAREHGIRGFWGGSTMRLGRLIFSGGIVFSVYENVAALLSGRSK